MQLRIARLCLDCEEIHAEDRCPRCISEHYAMMTTWLPVEERRRFRRPSPRALARRPGLLGVVDAIARWIQGGTVIDSPAEWATRRSDRLARDLQHGATSAASRTIDTHHPTRADVEGA